MLCLPGCAALSEFRLRKIHEQIEPRLPDVEDVEAFFLHFVDLERALDASERERLERLLDYGETDPVTDLEDLSLVVIPRPGTVSPWSSKASDILHDCGLDAVRRVERGVAWRLGTSAQTASSAWRWRPTRPSVRNRKLGYDEPGCPLEKSLSPEHAAYEDACGTENARVQSTRVPTAGSLCTSSIAPIRWAR